jgi:hypothetical protein
VTVRRGVALLSSDRKVLAAAPQSWSEQMAFKETTYGDQTYWVNTDQIAHVKKVPDGSLIQFAALSDNKSLTLHVNQTPEQILGSGLLRTYQ